MKQKLAHIITPPILFIIVSLLLGLFAVKFLPQFPVDSDSLKYDTIALGLVEQGTFLTIEEVTYPPGYPMFLAGIYSIFGHTYPAVYLLQFLLLGAIAYGVFRITRDHLRLPPLWATVAGGVVLLWPYFILYSLLLMSEILFIAFLTWHIYFLITFVRKKDLKNGIIATTFLALATIVRPLLFLLPFWMIFFLLIAHHISRDKKTLQRWCMVFFVFGFMLMPMFLITKAGSEDSRPASFHFSHVFEKAFVTLAYEDGRETSQKIAMRDVVFSKARNVLLFWNPGAGGYQTETLTRAIPSATYALTLYKIGFFILLLLAFRAFVFYKNLSVFILMLTIIYFWLLHSLFFPYPRYTLPVIPLVVSLAFFTLYKYRDLLQKSGVLLKQYYGNNKN